MNCNFPSKELLAERRRVAQLATGSTDAWMVEVCADFVLKCDLLRMLHEDITGCDCWLKAVKDSKVAA